MFRTGEESHLYQNENLFLQQSVERTLPLVDPFLKTLHTYRKF